MNKYRLISKRHDGSEFLVLEFGALDDDIAISVFRVWAELYKSQAETLRLVRVDEVLKPILFVRL